MRVRCRERQCGGLTATALVAAARLGCRCAYAGTLGDDEHSQFVLQRFREEGIDASRVRRQADARPVRSSIIVASGGRTRTLLFDIDGVVGPDATWPPEDVIRGARALIVDHCGVAGMVRAARIAREEGMPVVADLESMDDPLFPALLDLVDHLILSRGFALRLTGQQDAATAARALWAPQRQRGGRHLRQRRLLVRERRGAGRPPLSAGIGDLCGGHDRLRRRFSRRLRGGLGARNGDSGRVALCLRGRRLEGRAPRRPGGHPHAFGSRGADGQPHPSRTFDMMTRRHK